MQEMTFIEKLEKFSGQFAGAIWNTELILLLVGAGLVFTIMYRLPQLRFFKHSIDVILGRYDKPEDKGEISHFQALCAALSATVGLGNIAGVAVAISAGGAGAVFWMWVAGLLGMSTKFTSISLAMIFREVKSDGTVHGGPMYTIKHGLAERMNSGATKKLFYFLAGTYALFTILSSFGAGNMFQANQMADILHTNFNVPTYISGGLFCIFAGLVLIGGIKRIGDVASKLVPFMIAIYILGAIGILVANASAIPGMLVKIVSHAFEGLSLAGGAAGVLTTQIIQGFRRGVFSNEAGMGSAAMAHAAAKSDAIQEGVVGLLGPFIDTIVVCTMTALVILITGKETSDLQGSALTADAFGSLYGVWGSHMVTLAVVLFAFSTIISWSYYGEQGVTYLFGEKSILAYRIVFIAFIFIGASWKLGPVLNFSDAVFGLMAIPNLIANLLLTKQLKTRVTQYEEELVHWKHASN